MGIYSSRSSNSVYIVSATAQSNTMIACIALVIALLGPSLSEASSTCGVKPFSARVVNGQNAQPHAWPWQISLRVGGRHICGGSLIGNNWVITAAHCVSRNPRPSGYTVVVGAHRRTGTTSVQRTFRLRQLFKHEGFSMNHLRNDIALLQLAGNIQPSSKVNTVCLPKKGSRVPTGSRCFITGWGRTVGGGSAADVLQQAMLPVASHQACSRVNGRLLPVDERSMVCAGEGVSSGGCQGDSGGPFVCQENGKWVLRGAVSWGHSWCRTDHYTVFARVSSFIDWLNQKMSGSGGGGGGGGGGGSSCVDKNRYCRYWKRYCSYNSYVRAYCKKTCQLC